MTFDFPKLDLDPNSLPAYNSMPIYNIKKLTYNFLARMRNEYYARNVMLELNFKPRRYVRD